ncbi:hypothetical protein [Sphingobium yanoikuyae]|uniref:hypothetical protein n=1 Tax=Sphingobium yanoikuyae TaxID=13690 RepID=UPI00293C4118|nr:hypothetical protein [Sphingobium yanoikuyae]MDV3482255.1 hypothetical protein [Sphingobium yanoikuyae]
MTNSPIDVLDCKVADRFRSLAVEHASVLPDTVPSEIVALDSAMRDWRKPALMRDFGPAFTVLWRKLREPLTPQQRRSFVLFYLASKALQIEAVLERRSLTPALIARYPLALTRLADVLENPPEKYDLDNELFVKDFRMLQGLGLPAGAAILDIRSATGGTILQGIACRSPLWVARTCGKVPCFRLYLDPRYLEDFNRDGMHAYYRETAELLIKHPDVYGFVCRSWFMDPQLESISPRLSHLTRVPLSAGAFVINRSASEKDIERATRTSYTRKRLYDAGEYKPMSSSLVWPRKAMIAWATSQTAPYI